MCAAYAAACNRSAIKTSDRRWTRIFSVQMPSGIPVAIPAISSAKMGILATKILAVNDEKSA